MSFGVLWSESTTPTVLVESLQSKYTNFSGYIDVYTTSPTRPWVVRVSFINGAVVPAAYELPTEPQYDCLCMTAYIIYKSSMQRFVPNHCGTARVLAGEKKATFRFDDGSPGLGTLAFTITGKGPRASVAYPECKEARAISADLVALTKRSYENTTCIDDALKVVHVPTLPCMFPFLPGFVFAALRPIVSESDEFFMRALRAAARQRRWVLRDALRDDDKACVLLAESLAVVPNCFVYNEDCRVLPDGTIVPEEAFYAENTAGDCEDNAKKLMNYANELRFGSFTSPEVLRIQQMLSNYIVAEQFACVLMASVDTSDPNFRYLVPSGKPPGAAPSEVSYFAHGFVVFLPVEFVRAALRRGADGVARLANEAPCRPVKVLVQDGIALFSALPLEPYHPEPTGLVAQSDGARTMSEERIGENYYRLMSCCMVEDDMIVSVKYGTPVREIEFFTGQKYGAKFVDVVNQSPVVGMKPSCVVTPKQDECVRKCLPYFHPITPIFTGTRPDLKLMEHVLNTREVTAPPAIYTGTFFIQSSDALDERYLKTLRRESLPKNYTSSKYVVDWFSKECFRVQVYLN